MILYSAARQLWPRHILSLVEVANLLVMQISFLLALPFKVKTLWSTQKCAKVWYPYMVMWSPLKKHFQHNSSIHLGFNMLPTMCIQFSMLNIYHPYGYHLKGRAVMQPAACFFLLFAVCCCLYCMVYQFLSSSLTCWSQSLSQAFKSYEGLPFQPELFTLCFGSRGFCTETKVTSIAEVKNEFMNWLL